MLIFIVTWNQDQSSREYCFLRVTRANATSYCKQVSQRRLQPEGGRVMVSSGAII